MCSVSDITGQMASVTVQTLSHIRYQEKEINLAIVIIS